MYIRMYLFIYFVVIRMYIFLSFVYIRMYMFFKELERAKRLESKLIRKWGIKISEPAGIYM